MRRAWLMAALALAGCQGEVLVRVPVADAGADRSVPTHVTATLDGTFSAGYGRQLSFAWRVLSRPAGSTAQLSSETAERPTITPDRDGAYVISLVVTTDDDVTSAADGLVLAAYNVPPVIVTGSEVRRAYQGEQVALDLAAEDANDDSLAISWSMVGRPAGSAATLSDGGPRPWFVPDVAGDYELAARVSDGQVVVEQQVIVNASPPARLLDGEVLHAAYSDARDALVIATRLPDLVQIVTFAGGVAIDTPVPTPTSLSLAADGRVVVGHDRAVSVITFGDGPLRDSYPLSIFVHAATLAANGRIYATGPTSDLEGLHELDLATREERTFGREPYGGSDAALDPSGTRLYAAERQISPTDILRFDLAGDTPQLVRRGLASLDGGSCAGLWFSDDGARIFTGCGVALRVTEDPATDLFYNGGIQETGAVAFVDHSTVAGKLVVVPRDIVYPPGVFDDVAFHLRAADFLELERTVPEGSFRAFGVWFRGATRWAFISADGTKVYSIVQGHLDGVLRPFYALVVTDL